MSKQGAISGGLSGAGIGGSVGGGYGALIGGGVGALAGAFGFLDPDDEDQKKLIRKQEQMAREARAREDSLRRAGLQSLGQTMGAFGPRNRAMAEMFGPEAAFSGEEVANMTADPEAIRGKDGAPALKAPYPWIQDAYDRGEHNMPLDLYSYKALGTDTLSQEQKESHYLQLQEYARQRREWEAQEGARRAAAVKAFTPTSDGPARIPTTQAAPAKRY
jgi:hypothetical protein